ncbi:MAG: tRNA (guanosine(46)-N7)-methyltransferase TrmB [Myxococcales bacterium]|nr:tRNA (guanosine(46)-N7)-methyltransferase TrmB [Myxococcales bacterium]
MARRLKTDLAGVDRRVLPETVREQGWPRLFAPDLPDPKRFVVEIGFGRGEFLLALAEAAPDTAFVGVELSHKRLVKMARRLARLELSNVRLLEARGELVVSELLAPGSVDELWVNFSDPWPKRRHFDRRLIQPEFVAAVARCLTAGGLLQVATDDPGYAEWIDRILPAAPGLENAHAPAPHLREVPGRMQTAYEREWRQRGRTPFFWTYRRSLASVPSPSE